MKKILFNLFLLVIPYLSSLEPEDYEWKIHSIREDHRGKAFILIKDDKKNVYAFYEIKLDDFFIRYDHALFSLHEIDFKEFVKKFDYISLEEVQDMLPEYNFTEENYGF